MFGSDARRYFETFIGCQKQFLNKKSHRRRRGTIFSAGPFNKAVQSFRNSLIKVLEGRWKTF